MCAQAMVTALTLKAMHIKICEIGTKLVKKIHDFIEQYQFIRFYLLKPTFYTVQPCILKAL